MAETKGYSLEMQVNGQTIAMNSFVTNFYINTLLGSLQALRDIPEDITAVNISIKQK